jgi:hypothetical protein
MVHEGRGGETSVGLFGEERSVVMEMTPRQCVSPLYYFRSDGLENLRSFSLGSWTMMKVGKVFLEVPEYLFMWRRTEDDMHIVPILLDGVFHVAPAHWISENSRIL